MLGAVYAHLSWVVDPRLILHDGSPTFHLQTGDFGRAVRLWPGGGLEYIAAGLSQVLAIGWLGAGVLTVCVGVLWWATGRLLATRGREITPPPGMGCENRSSVSERAWAGLAAFVPALLVIVQFGRFALSLGALVGLVLTLVLAWGYARVGGRPVIRALMGVASCAGLYVALGPVSVLFAVVCGLIELLERRSTILGLLMLVAGAVLPWLIGGQLYGVPTRDAYLRITAFDYDFLPPVGAIALYACVPILMIVGRLRRRSAARPALVRAGRRQWRWLEPVLLVAVGGLAAWLSFDRDRATVLAIDYHVRHQQWDATLAAAEPLRRTLPDTRVDARLLSLRFGYGFPVDACRPAPLLASGNAAIHDINLALAHKGILLDAMFEYPQRMQASVVRLLPDDNGGYVSHSYNTDILLELGDVNEAERVACESLANIGPRSWLLERLTWINVLKQRPEAARTCLNLMARDPSSRSRAEAWLRDLEADPTLASRKDLNRVRSRMFRQDRVGHLEQMDRDEEQLRYLLVANPHNRFAFDYLTAHYLLKLRHDKVADNMQHLAAFGYKRVPRHCEEAILLHASLTGDAALPGKFGVRPETAARFEAFRRDFDLLGGTKAANRIGVRDALLASYGDTYWFYALFGDTYVAWPNETAASRPEEQP